MKRILATISFLFFTLLAWNLRAAENISLPVAGHWDGNARIIVSWCHQTNLSLSIDISTNGSVTGKVGDALLGDGHFEANRGWLGRKLNLATDHIITGKLDGPIVGAEGITRDKIYIGLFMTDNALVGGINTGGSFCLFCSQVKMKERMSFSARPLKLVRSSPKP